MRSSLVVIPVPAPKRGKCSPACPKGQHCELQRLCYFGICAGYQNVCVKSPAAIVERPPSCQGVRCSSVQTCVLKQVVCVRAPCYPVPVCVADGCAIARCLPGRVCIMAVIPGSDPACSNFPDCRYRFSCQPRAKPKPGFCPPPKQVSQGEGNGCKYDNDCVDPDALAK
ncbi:uncharacterized protein LOC119095725 [Pollicipes pollicipes]|uniref:uncharacterized protein LOC119095725 n=1 Tax=Pollicipes pollicipes TaxID=41117 RepID=UPI0018857426|nr:uncharacterized protein LOC119095725 [Pollicipes pollicipes]